MTRTAFGTLPDGDKVEQVTIRGGGLTATVLSYGAIVQDLRLEGVGHPLVLGSESLDPYLGPMRNMGPMVGRFANRIADGRFEIDGETFQADRNFLGKHSLHGGVAGSGTLNWRIEDVAADAVTLALTLPDGHMGFPGNMDVRAAISLPGAGALQIEVTAHVDAPSPCSFAHHGYFNLDGGPDVTAHQLQIEAPDYLEVDNELIPDGGPRPVSGTRFDFRTPRAIGSETIDHNFCLAGGRGALRKVAVLQGPESGVFMQVETTEPGLQIYNAAHFPGDGLPGLDGRRYGPMAGLAMETQNWPDAPNRPDFPDAILRPGETYRHVMRYVFGRGR